VGWKCRKFQWLASLVGEPTEGIPIATIGTSGVGGWFELRYKDDVALLKESF
jgi:hypothetical protein